MSTMYESTEPEIHTELTFKPGNPDLGGAKFIAYFGGLAVQPCRDPFCKCGCLGRIIEQENSLVQNVVLIGPVTSSRTGFKSFIAHRYLPPPDRLRFNDHFIAGSTAIGSGHGQLVFLGGIGEAGSRVCFLAIHDKSAVMFDCGVNVAALEAPAKKEADDEETYSDSGEEPRTIQLYPDFDRLIAMLEDGIKLEAVVVSHGHYDHMAGIGELLRRLQEKQIPLPEIYGSPFTISIIYRHLESARQDNPSIPAPVTHDIKAGFDLRLGGFHIKPYEVFHSVPEALGFAFIAEGDTCATIYTGDFKTRWQKHFDVFTTARGYEAIKHDWPIRLLITDGTNACVPGVSGLESNVEEGLGEALLTSTGQVIYICFSSHIARISEIVRLASAANVGAPAIYGQSFKAPLEAASRMGLSFNYHNDLGRTRVAIVTGCQANATSVAKRLSQGDRISGFQIDETCTVVESAMPIPGRGGAVCKMLHDFQKLGARVIVDPAFPGKNRIYGAKTMPVHVSGHGFAEDIQTVVKAVQADYILPFHCSEEAMMEVGNIATLATDIPDSNIILPSSNGFTIEF